MDPHDAHAAAVRHNNALVRGTYEEGYSAGKAEGIKEGMRRAAGIARIAENTSPVKSKQDMAARIKAAILKAIGE